MQNPILSPRARMVVITLVLLAAVTWLQQQHLANTAHMHALLVLVLVGFLAFWMAQGKPK